jgi:hypothetical protein
MALQFLRLPVPRLVLRRQKPQFPAASAQQLPMGMLAVP